MSENVVISIVDDYEPMREGITDVVGALGYSAASFASGEDFLNSDRVDDTSCLIADVCMPGMTGIELHSRLVAAGKAIPTVLITGYPDKGFRSGALSAGVICFLKKPFSDSDFLDCIRLALYHSRPAGNS